MDQTEIRQIQEVMDKAVSSGEVSGVSVKVMKDFREILFTASGYADAEAGRPMAPDTILRLYSMSKPVTGAAVMLLFERGLLDLGEPVSRYFPSFESQTYVCAGGTAPVKRPVLIHDLLSMTSGLPYSGESAAGLGAAALFDEAVSRMGTDREMTTAEFASRLGSNPLEFSPGEHFLYGTSADVLGAVVEAVSGMKFGDFLKRELFEPLEMPDTGFYVPPEKQGRLSKAYTRRPDGSLECYTGNHLAINNRYDTPPAFESGGAGLTSTLEDYSHFARMLLENGSYCGHRILKEETVRFFTQSRLLPWQQEDFQRNWPGLVGYSYGNLMRSLAEQRSALMLTTPREYGWDGWLGTYFSNHPAGRMTFLLGIQMTDAGTTPLTRKIRNMVLSGGLHEQ